MTEQNTHRADEASADTGADEASAADTSAADALTVLGGHPDSIQHQALGSVIDELAAEAKATRDTQSHRGGWGLPGEGLQPVESYHPRSYQNRHRES